MYKKPPFTETQRRARANFNTSLWRMENKEKYNAKQKEWREKDPKKTKESLRRWRYKHKYGITLEEAELILKKQGDICAICKRSIKLGGIGGASIDHCHASNIFRGILCKNCNVGLGAFEDNVTILFNAINYLRNFHTRTEGEIGVAG